MLFNHLFPCFYLISKLPLLAYQRNLSVVVAVLPTTSNFYGDQVCRILLSFFFILLHAPLLGVILHALLQ